MKKTAIIGATGYIGCSLIEYLRTIYPDCIGTFFKNSKEKKNTYFDLQESNIHNLKLEQKSYEYLIISSGIANISVCENNPKYSYDINVKGVLNLVNNLVKTKIKIIYLSSDYIFDGLKGNYLEEDIANPKTVYGQQKKEVENQLEKFKEKVIILRLSKIYGLIKGDKTLLDEAAFLLSQKQEIVAAKNQFFSPTFIGDLLNAISIIQKKNIFGKINFCSDEIWSRYNLMVYLANCMKVDKKLVKSIYLNELDGFKNRPLNTTMNCEKIKSIIKFRFHSIRESCQKVANNYAKKI